MAGGKKSGKLGLPSNGCLRYVVLYLLALVLLIAGLIGTSGGLLSRFGLPSSNSNSGQTTISSAQTTGASSSSGSTVNTGSDLPANSGGSAPAEGATLGILGAPVQSNQGGTVTPYIYPAFYIVEENDTLGTIAIEYGTTAAELISYNRLPNETVYPGQVLSLPPGTYQPVPDTGRNAGK